MTIADEHEIGDRFVTAMIHALRQIVTEGDEATETPVCSVCTVPVCDLSRQNRAGDRREG